MPRQSKKTAAAKTKTTKRSKTTKVAAAATATAAPASVATPVAAAAAESTAPVSSFTEQFERLSGLTQQLQESFSAGKSFAGEIRKLVSAISRYEKKAQRTTRRRNTTGRTTQSGITRPVRISDQLCSFLGENKGALIARTAVTKRLTAYIRENNLQNPENRKQIFPDVKLQALLNPLRKEDREKGYTYFNLQHYLKHHYQKVEATTNASKNNAASVTA